MGLGALGHSYSDIQWPGLGQVWEAQTAPGDPWTCGLQTNVTLRRDGDARLALSWCPPPGGQCLPAEPRHSPRPIHLERLALSSGTP